MLQRFLRHYFGKFSRKTLLIEGWRGINQSYAMVNQYQLLELRKYRFKLLHKDLPFYRDEWNAAQNSSGFDEEDKQRIFSVPSQRTRKADVTYRISYPYRFYESASERLFVYGTSELQHLDDMVWDGQIDIGINNPSLKIVTPSHWSKIGFLNAGFEDERVLVVPHGVDCNIYRPSSTLRRRAVRAALALADSDFVVLSVGAMSWNKGIDKLLLAYSHLKKKYRNLKLVLKDQSNLYGMTAKDVINEIRKTHAQHFDDATISSIVLVSSNLTLRQLSDLYGAADCYASPYRAEGFNLPPLEAAACGVPLVLTGGGSSDDYWHDSFGLKIAGEKVRDGKKAFIEPDLDSLISCVAALIERSAERVDPVKAVEHIRENHSWALAVRRLVRVFRE